MGQFKSIAYNIIKAAPGAVFYLTQPNDEDTYHYKISLLLYI